MYFVDDAEEDGRILSDDEYSEALKNRDDIFLVENGGRLHAIELAILCISVVFCFWLNSLPKVTIAPDFYENILKERMAKLTGERRLSAPVRKNREDTPGSGERPNEIKADFKAGTGRRAGGEMKQESAASRSSVKSSSRSPAAAPVNQQAPIDDRERISAGDSILIRQGDVYRKQGNHAGAFAAYRRVLKQNPRNTKALAGIGDLFLYTGILDSAAAFYTAALAVNPRIASVHDGLGSVRYYYSDFAANPNYTARNKILDPARYIKSQYDSAIIEYTQAISLDSTCVDALTNRGVLRDIHKDYQAAIEDYSRAIRINPSFADAYCKRAATYKTLGKYDEAIADFTAAIKRDSSTYDFDPTLRFADAYFGRATVYYRMGNLDKAIADYDSTLALKPDHSLAFLHKALALADEKRYDSAIVCYTKAISLLSPTEYDQSQEHAYFGRGLIYDVTGRPALAIKDFNEAIRLKPSDYFAYLHRGNAFKAQGNYDFAIADYTKALASRQLAAKASWRMAECFSLKQDKVDALKWLKAAVSFGFSDFKEWDGDKELSLLWNTREFHEITGR